MALDQLKVTYKNQLETAGKCGYQFVWFSKSIVQITQFVIHQMLSKHHQEFLAVSIVQLVRECVINAVKANAKRAWVIANDLDLNRADASSEVLQRFRDEVVDHLTDYAFSLKENDLCVKMYYASNDSGFDIIIQNNVEMTTSELSRVRERIEWARTAENLFEGYELFNDNREGAGLGLALNLILLKQAGLGPENFKIQSANGSTTVRLSVPSQINTPENVLAMQDRITTEIDSIPEFPETIQKVVALCDNPKSGLGQVASEIEMSPALATALLKTANSPAYRRERPVNSVSDAASFLGIKLIRELSIAKEILASEYKTFGETWEHGQKCAIYAKSLAEKLGFKSLRDQAYLGGLLHDLGKIVLFSIEPETIKKLNGLTIDRNKNDTARLEEISLGISHATIGGMLAKQWNFSDMLVEMIEHHHSPFAAKPGNKIAVSLIHIADALLRSEEASRSYVHFDLDAMTELGIESHMQLRSLHDNLLTLSQTGQVA